MRCSHACNRSQRSLLWLTALVSSCSSTLVSALTWIPFGSFLRRHFGGTHLHTTAILSSATETPTIVDKAADGAVSIGTTTKLGELPMGVVHFLFLVNSTLQHASVWRRFFEVAPPGSWRAWVHCADPDACRAGGIFDALPAFVQVPTVPSMYCIDLVTPTVQLVRHALASEAATNGTIEKFALVSETTLPVKPFAEVHKALTSDDKSDLCIAPSGEWRGAHVDAIKVHLVKHSQWFVLNRQHAEVLVNDWEPPHAWDAFVGWWQLPLKSASWITKRRKIAARRFLINAQGAWACTDEEAIFATIFGAFEPSRDHKMSSNFDGFGDLSLLDPLSTQGRCRTFTVFKNTKDLGNLTDPIMEVVRSDPSTSTVQHADLSHPLVLSCAGRRTLAALRASPFLFARKFGPDGNDLTEEETLHRAATESSARSSFRQTRKSCGDGTSYASVLVG